MIPFNKPFLQGNEIKYIQESIKSGKISGDGIFTKKCHNFFETNFDFKKVLLTTSCTDALEMSAILLNIKEGDEVIAPSFTFVSTINAFVLRGAKIIFADSELNTPNLDVYKVENLITPRTKVIVCVHYAGVACDMDILLTIAKKNNLFVIEDAAQAIDSFYKGKVLGSIGNMSAFSFHETKNIISGEGGMIVINDEIFAERAEIIREKGTNRSQFFRGEVDKYGWVDIGSSFLPSDLIAAYLFAQLEQLKIIQRKRKLIWQYYYENLKVLEDKGFIKMPHIPNYATNNAHMFYILCPDLLVRTELIKFLKNNSIQAVFHYLSLHKSPFYESLYKGEDLINSDKYSDTLLRLPFYVGLTTDEQNKVIEKIFNFFNLPY